MLYYILSEGSDELISALEVREGGREGENGQRQQRQQQQQQQPHFLSPKHVFIVVVNEKESEEREKKNIVTLHISHFRGGFVTPRIFGSVQIHQFYLLGGVGGIH